MNKALRDFPGCVHSLWETYGLAAMVLYRSVQLVDESSVDGRVFTAEWWITMSVIPSRTPSVQGTTEVPRMCTQAVGDVRGPPPFSCTGPYSGCTEIPLIAECSPLSGGIP